jgi:NitT/TauT family transport system substrate-binding protein
MRLTRLVSVLSTALALAFAGSTAHAADKASIRLSWYIGGYHAAYFLGKERGFYKDEGIDLTINEGRGSAKSAQLVAAGSDTFGVSDSSSMMLGAAKGLPIKCVVSLMNSAGFAVLYLPDKPIKTIADLKGKTVAMAAGDALTQLFPAVLSANGLKSTDVHQLLLDPAGKQAALLAGKVDAMLGDIGAQGVILAEKGHPVKSIRFGDVGVDTIGLVIHTNTDTIKNNPDLVRRFVHATVRSWELTRKDPDAAVQAVLHAKPSLSADLVKKQLMVFISYMDTPNTKGKPLGYGAPADWKHTYQLYKELRGMKTSMQPKDFHTNEFLPKQ